MKLCNLFENVSVGASGAGSIATFASPVGFKSRGIPNTQIPNTTQNRIQWQVVDINKLSKPKRKKQRKIKRLKLSKED